MTSKAFSGSVTPVKPNDDAVFPRGLETWFDNTELIDTPAQNLQGALERVNVRVLLVELLSLQHDLGSASEIETEFYRTIENESGANAENGDYQP